MSAAITRAARTTWSASGCRQVAAKPRPVLAEAMWPHVCPLRPAPGPWPMVIRTGRNPGQAARRSLPSPSGAKGHRCTSILHRGPPRRRISGRSHGLGRIVGPLGDLLDADAENALLLNASRDRRDGGWIERCQRRGRNSVAGGDGIAEAAKAQISTFEMRLSRQVMHRSLAPANRNHLSIPSCVTEADLGRQPAHRVPRGDDAPLSAGQGVVSICRGAVNKTVSLPRSAECATQPAGGATVAEGQ